MTLAASVQAAPAAQAALTSVASRVAALNTLLAEQWQHTVAEQPGVRHHAGRSSLQQFAGAISSLAYVASERTVNREFPQAFQGDRHDRFFR
jgi:hypothetical protein